MGGAPPRRASWGGRPRRCSSARRASCPRSRPVSLVSPCRSRCSARGRRGRGVARRRPRRRPRGGRRARSPPAGFYLLVLAVPGLLLGESPARGRGLLARLRLGVRGVVAEIAAGLASPPQAMAERFAPIESPALGGVPGRAQGGRPAPSAGRRVHQKAGGAAGATRWRSSSLGFCGCLGRGAGGLNAAPIRLYLLRRDPGWLEDGEFERVRWPLALAVVFVLAGAAVTLPLARPVAYNVLLVTAFFFALQGLAVVAFYARRLAGPPLLRAGGGRPGAGQPLGPADPRPAGAVRQLVRLPPLGRAPARGGRGDPAWTTGVIQSRGESWS